MIGLIESYSANVRLIEGTVSIASRQCNGARESGSYRCECASYCTLGTIENKEGGLSYRDTGIIQIDSC